jgi:hypothetical protein
MQMRRVITFALVVALTYAGLGVFAPAQRSPGARPAAAATARLTAQAGRTGFKIVRYAGYTIRVPAAWPVYRLDRDPSRCVRYDRHAVYLGTPGANQQCPAHLVGRAATISIQAAGPGSAGPGSPGAGSGPAGPVDVGPAVGTVPQAGASVTRDAQDQEMRASLADPGVSVTGTYAGATGGVLSILRSLRRAGRSRTSARTTASPGAGGVRAQVMTRSAAALRATHPIQHRHRRAHHGRQHRQARKHHTARHHAPRHHAPRHRARKHRARKHPRHPRRARPRTPRLRQALHGFDSCTTPSVAAMQSWRRAFSAMAVYIGGVEAGCASPNLTAGWVRAVTAMGWSLMPTYVGRQASCSAYSVRIRPARAAAQGRAAALDAIHQATALGMGRGTPVYYDMEAYRGHRRCRNATMAFLDAWTRTLHALGYTSGVYSSASSGAENLGWAHTVNGHRIAKPDSMWFGLWDNERNVRGLPYLLQSWWRGPRRIKQYEGPHKRTVGGYTLDIDSDWVFGAVYR